MGVRGKSRRQRERVRHGSNRTPRCCSAGESAHRACQGALRECLHVTVVSCAMSCKKDETSASVHLRGPSTLQSSSNACSATLVAHFRPHSRMPHTRVHTHDRTHILSRTLFLGKGESCWLSIATGFRPHCSRRPRRHTVPPHHAQAHTSCETHQNIVAVARGTNIANWRKHTQHRGNVCSRASLRPRAGCAQRCDIVGRASSG